MPKYVSKFLPTIHFVMLFMAEMANRCLVTRPFTSGRGGGVEMDGERTDRASWTTRDTGVYNP